MREECDTCKYNDLRTNEEPCDSCSDATFDKWQPKEETMEERLKSIVARVRKMTKTELISLSFEVRDHSHLPAVVTDIMLYRANEDPAHNKFPTIEALESYVCELEEKYRPKSEAEQIREYIRKSGICDAEKGKLMTQIDVITGILPF